MLSGASFCHGFGRLPKIVAQGASPRKSRGASDLKSKSNGAFVLKSPDGGCRLAEQKLLSIRLISLQAKHFKLKAPRFLRDIFRVQSSTRLLKCGR